jgi:signal transduction histidine kinase
MGIRQNLLHSSSYQVGMLLAVLVSLGVFFVSYWLVIASDNALLREPEEAIRAEIRSFQMVERLAGRSGVEELLRNAMAHNDDYFYGYRDEKGTWLEGNIPEWPDRFERLNEGTLLFEIEHGLLPDRPASARLGSEHFDVMAKVHTLSDGSQLIVGRDVDDLQIAQWVAEAFGWAMIIILLVICALSFGVAYYVTSRFTRIAATTERIIATGNLGERLQVDSTWDDLSKLSRILNRMLEELEARVDGIQSVTDSIAHDLRTPLTRLRASITTLVSGQAGEALVEEVDGLLRIFSSLLRISAIEAGKAPMASSEICLETLTRDMIDLYEPLAREKGQVLVHSPSNSTSSVVTGDADLLCQAVANLLDNAVKFTPAGGTITVRNVRHGELAALEVLDTGPGIPPEQRERALQRFGRLDASRSLPGNGLGLPLAAAIIRRHGGSVTLEEAGSGVSGLRVTVRLPGSGG